MNPYILTSAKTLILSLLASISMAADYQAIRIETTVNGRIQGSSQSKISGHINQTKTKINYQPPKLLDDSKTVRTPVDIGRSKTKDFYQKDLDADTRVLGPGSSGGGQGVFMTDGSFRFLDLLSDAELANIRILPKNYFNYGRCVKQPFYKISNFEMPLKNIETRLKNANVPTKVILNAGRRLANTTFFSSATGLFIAQDSARIPNKQQINIGVNTGEHLIIFEPVFQMLSDNDKEALFLHEILRQYVYVYSLPLETGMRLKEIEEAVFLLYNNGDSEKINNLIKTKNPNFQRHEETLQWLEQNNLLQEEFNKKTPSEKTLRNILKRMSALRVDSFTIAQTYSYDELMDLLKSLLRTSDNLQTLREESNHSNFDEELTRIYNASLSESTSLQQKVYLEMLTRQNNAITSTNQDLMEVIVNLRQTLYGDRSDFQNKVDIKDLIDQGILLPSSIYNRKVGKVWSIGGKKWTSPANPICVNSTF